MPLSPKDKGQAFSGIGNQANPLKPRTLRPGGTEDVEESVDLNPIDQSRPRGLNENETPGATPGHDPSRAIGEGDAPYKRPADAPQSVTTPDFSLNEAQLDYEWGRRPRELTTCKWEDFASNPGYKIQEGDKQ